MNKVRVLHKIFVPLFGLLLLSSASSQTEATNADEQFQLALKYFNGGGLPKDNTEAAKWFRKAADQGHAEAQRFLGCRYQMGEGVPKDTIEATKWFRKAADQGDARSCRILGMCYAHGDGVSEDQTEAVKWFRKSAELGDSLALLFMGARSASGNGCPKDLVAAYMWYDLAKAAGQIRNKDTLEALAKEMTKEQITEALQKSNEWQASKAKESESGPADHPKGKTQ